MSKLVNLQNRSESSWIFYKLSKIEKSESQKWYGKAMAIAKKQATTACFKANGFLFSCLKLEPSLTVWKPFVTDIINLYDMSTKATMSIFHIAHRHDLTQ